MNERPSPVFATERDFEKALIGKLQQKAWREVLEYQSEKDLINNWKEIIYSNNQSKDCLNGVPLSDTEMDQILDHVRSLGTPFDIQKFISGQYVTIRRDNPADRLHLGKDVTLFIFNKHEISGGRSTYQIAEQPIFKKKDDIDHDRRGDFTLLINGMPLIHVELKKDDGALSHAVNQIRTYMKENVFTGLFSLVQIFVAMTPNETVYFANPGRNGRFQREFQFHWGDFNNDVVNNWQDIAEHLLSIPMAHQLIGYYTVADATDHTLKVLRSYQYYAVSRIENRVQKTDWQNPDIRGGYIWHTTGSGKTLTSFKCAQRIADSRQADKVIFLVDRIDLDIQSLADYKNFAVDADDVEGTRSTAQLFAILKSSTASRLIVTSIQKMDNLARRAKEQQIDMRNITNKRLVFIVDECHRDTFGDMMSRIKEVFHKAVYFGFTGTPIQEENAKKGCTTSDVFGNELSRYSIADGIRDGHVLKFDVDPLSIFPIERLRKQIALQKADADNDKEALEDPDKKAIYLEYMNREKHSDRDLENFLPDDLYTNSRYEYKKKVVEYIIDHFDEISQDHKFHGILATSSINEAIEYYRLFKIQTGDKALNVTAIYDTNLDFNDGALPKEDGMKEILSDYNERFNKIFSLSTMIGFKRDICLRLAHKEPYMAIAKNKAEQIDLVIVVDQLLTGFDAKWINVVYVDKMLQHEHIIQAFSRTNRLFDSQEKPFGIIKIFRRPLTMNERIEAAIKIYSGDRPAGIFVNKLPDNLKRSNNCFHEIESLFRSHDAEDFASLKNFDDADKAEFTRYYVKFNQLICMCRIQGMQWDKNTYAVSDHEAIRRAYDEQDHLALRQRYTELIASVQDKDRPAGAPPLDIRAEYVFGVGGYLIDDQFFKSRFKRWIKTLDSGSPEEREKALNELHASFPILSEEDQAVAKVVIDRIHSGDIKIDEKKTMRDYMNDYRLQTRNKEVQKMSDFTGIPVDKLKNFFDNVDKDNPDKDQKLTKLRKLANKELLKVNLEKQYHRIIEYRDVWFQLHKMIDTFMKTNQFIVEGF